MASSNAVHRYCPTAPSAKIRRGVRPPPCPPTSAIPDLYSSPWVSTYLLTSNSLGNGVSNAQPIIAVFTLANMKVYVAIRVAKIVEFQDNPLTQ